MKILLKKVPSCPKVKDQSPKVNGNICNIPITGIESNCKSFPRTDDF